MRMDTRKEIAKSFNNRFPVELLAKCRLNHAHVKDTLYAPTLSKRIDAVVTVSAADFVIPHGILMLANLVDSVDLPPSANGLSIRQYHGGRAFFVEWTSARDT